jgi:hypothetical protein
MDLDIMAKNNNISLRAGKSAPASGKRRRQFMFCNPLAQGNSSMAGFLRAFVPKIGL